MKQRSVDIFAYKSLPYTAACVSLLALVVVSLAWELWIASLCESGSWLALKALSLCPPLSGIPRGRVYTYQYSSTLVLIYFVETVMRLSDATFAGYLCVAAVAACCMVFFAPCMTFIKQEQRKARHG